MNARAVDRIEDGTADSDIADGAARGGDVGVEDVVRDGERADAVREEIEAFCARNPEVTAILD